MYKKSHIKGQKDKKSYKKGKNVIKKYYKNI